MYEIILLHAWSYNDLGIILRSSIGSIGVRVDVKVAILETYLRGHFSRRNKSHLVLILGLYV